MIQPQQQQQQRQNKMVSSKNATELLGDTTYTKIFVGGLAWETQKDTLKRYFEQFGEIHEAVVITDRSSGKSKGYGFVTFKDPESARRACLTPYPLIDGRRANCNLAYLGAQKNHPTAPDQHHHGMEKSRQPATPMATSSPVHGNSKYFPQLVPQYPFSYSAYGYPVYSQQIDAMNYYNASGGGQPLPSYYTNWASRFPGVYINYYPFYAQQQGQQSHSSPSQYPKMVHFPYLPHQYTTLGTVSLPASPSPSITGPATEMVTAVGKAPGSAKPNSVA